MSREGAPAHRRTMRTLKILAVASAGCRTLVLSGELDLSSTDEFEAMALRHEFAEYAYVFGNRYGTAQAPIDAALAAGRDLHLLLLHPSPALWEKVAHRADHSGRSAIARREDDETVTLAANRLLASWGRDSREMQLVLTAGAPAMSDTHHASPSPPDTVLGRLQQSVREDRGAPGAPLPARSW